MPYLIQFYKPLCVWVIVVWLWEYIFPFSNLPHCPSLFCDNPYLAVSAGVSLFGLFWAPITDYLRKWSCTPRNFKSLLISDCILCFVAIDLFARYIQIYYGQCFVRTVSSYIPFQFIEIAVLVTLIGYFIAARLKGITKLNVAEIPEPISSYKLLPDEPIKKASDDILGFCSAADVFAKVIKENLTTPRSSSLTIGLTGRWGAGKTSFFNLLEIALRREGLRIEVIRFCAPLPLSTVEVIEQFFSHIEGAIKQKYLVPGLSTVLLRYKQLFSSLEGSFFKGLAAFTPRDEHSIRKSLEELLQGISETFVVLVDDFDRFSEDGEEQRVLLWLLRMFSAMPQFVFVVAYDPQKVSRGTEDRYIDKFIQLELPVPLSFDDQHNKLTEQIIGLVEANRDEKEKILEEERKRVEEFVANTRQRIDTLRDSKKFCNALIPALAAVGNLSPSDVIAVHYLRLYYPEVFQALMQHKHLLLKESQSNYEALIKLVPSLSAGKDPKSKPRDLLLAEVLKPIDLLESSSLKNIIDMVFPDGGGSLVNSELTGRLAISANLDKYLSYTEFASDVNVFYIAEFLNSFLSLDVAVERRASKLTAFLEKFPTLGYPLNLILESKHHEIRSLLHSKRLLFGESLARASNILVAQILGNGSFIEAHIARAVFDAVRLELPDQYSEWIEYLTERAREGSSSPLYLASLVKEFSINSSFANIYKNNLEQLTEFFNRQVNSFAKFKNCGIDDYPDASVRSVILSQLALSISLSGLSDEVDPEFWTII